ncbi:GNAT family N-acetyltransferase [Halobacillus locisalis]|uniref:GNAT family N-acetyltransferase n=1 Tax=Halobacillus locisalis TaxID=220753 RepID=A0A838CWP0_9BACI|nr:GNAT family N-acetyltransferase [Halobacillus locisalis]MBA2176333.1 GNAT family N-acetyltransferase [Halobacillus locisalis]
MITIVDVQPHHLDRMHEWEMNEALQVKTGIEKPRSYEKFIDSYHSYLRGEKPRLMIKVIEEDGKAVGKVELYQSPKDAFIGMVIAERQRQGIGAKALELFLRDIKEKLGLHSVCAEVYEDNPDSLRFFERNQFKRTGDVTVEMFRGYERRLIVLNRIL